MPSYVLPNTVSSKDLISFDLFPVKDNSLVSNLIPKQNLEASDNIINFILRNLKWYGYKFLDIDSNTKIGYNQSTSLDSKGMTEESAFNNWIGDFKELERKFKRQLLLDNLSQSQYDSLLSMFYFTGSFISVGTPKRTFDLSEFIKNRQWEYIATAMTLSGGKGRTLRQSEAKIMMLADYGITKDRSLIKQQGLQELVKRYPDRFIDNKAKEQAEYIYFAETKRFLPNMSESRKRLLAQELK